MIFAFVRFLIQIKYAVTSALPLLNAFQFHQILTQKKATTGTMVLIYALVAPPEKNLMHAC